jgi:hypothetical protein
MDSADDTAEAVGCPIRKSSDHSLLAAPRGLSQRATSFIASQCQGIHQMPLRRLISDEPRTHPHRGGNPRSDRPPSNARAVGKGRPGIRKMHHPSAQTSRPSRAASLPPPTGPVRAVFGQYSSSHVQDPVMLPPRGANTTPRIRPVRAAGYGCHFLSGPTG